MDPIQWLMQMLQGGGTMGPMGIGQTEMPMPGSPGMAMPPGGGMGAGMGAPSPMMPPSPAPPPVSQVQTLDTPPLPQAGVMNGVTPPLPMAKPPVPGGQNPAFDPQQLAALQAITQPENENQGPPSPPSAPAGPRAIDPGLLFEALLKLGVHPGQFPSLQQKLKGM